MQDVFKVEDEDPILFLEHVFRTCLPNSDLRTDLLTATGGFFVCPEARDTSREMSARDCQQNAISGGYVLRVEDAFVEPCKGRAQGSCFAARVLRLHGRIYQQPALDESGFAQAQIASEPAAMRTYRPALDEGGFPQAQL